jgi:hypothetical protein
MRVADLLARLRLDLILLFRIDLSERLCGPPPCER